MNSVQSDDTPRSGPGRALLVCLLIALPAMAIGFHPLGNNDLPMHLAIGEWILAHGEVPDRDPFSFTADPEKLWVPHEWLAGVLFAVVDRAGGVHLLVATMVLLSGLLALSAAAVAKELGTPPREVLLWSFPVWLMAGRRLMLRPHLIALSLVFAVWWLLLAGRRRPRLLWLVPVVMVLWVNVHGSFPLGLASCVLGLLFLPGHTAGPGQRSAVLLASAGALLLQPHGFEGLVAPFRLTSDPVFMNYILEWARPFGSGGQSEVFRATPNFWLSIPWIGLVLVGLYRSRNAVPLAYQLFVFGCLVLYVRHQRYLALFVLASLPCLPFMIWRPSWSEARRRYLPAGMAVGTAALALILGYPSIWGTALRKPGSSWSTRIPLGEAELIAQSGYQGPVLTEYEFGSVVAWQGRGKLQVSMDSRNSVYGSELLLRHDAVLNDVPSAHGYQTQLVRRCGAALIRNPVRYPNRQGIFWRLNNDDDWEYMQLRAPDANLVPLPSHFTDRYGDEKIRTAHLDPRTPILFLRKQHLEGLEQRQNAIREQRTEEPEGKEQSR